jgi:hypothetical protein
MHALPVRGYIFAQRLMGLVCKICTRPCGLQVNTTVVMQGLAEAGRSWQKLLIAGACASVLCVTTARHQLGSGEDAYCNWFDCCLAASEKDWLS